MLRHIYKDHVSPTINLHCDLLVSISTGQVLFLLQVVPIGHYAHICKRRLDRINSVGARKGLKKPTLEEIEQAKVTGTSSYSGVTLSFSG